MWQKLNSFVWGWFFWFDLINLFNSPPPADSLKVFLHNKIKANKNSAIQNALRECSFFLFTIQEFHNCKVVLLDLHFTYHSVKFSHIRFRKPFWMNIFILYLTLLLELVLEDLSRKIWPWESEPNKQIDFTNWFVRPKYLDWLRGIRIN